nr:MAG TPA: hypothetical protein [Caudoviricetes sp.]
MAFNCLLRGKGLPGVTPPQKSVHSVHTSLHSVHTSLHSVHTFLFAPLRHPHLCRRTINDNEQWQEYD